MITSFDIQKIFSETWGYIGLPFPEIVVKSITPQVNTYRAGGYQFNTPGRNDVSCLGVPFYAKNNLGREVFMPIWLFEKDNPSDSEKYLLPNTVMSMTCKKNIVITPLVNRKGTVKEEISIDDWELNVKGVMVGEFSTYPEEQKQLLVEWFNEQGALNIQNARTAICLSEGEKVVITSLTFPEIRGFENTQPFEVKMISDTPFSLYID